METDSTAAQPPTAHVAQGRWVGHPPTRESANSVAPQESSALERDSREDLVERCTSGVVPVDSWRNRDSSAAQRQLGEARALLAAGCEFFVYPSSGGGRLASDKDTTWVSVSWPGFEAFEYGRDGHHEDDTFFVPTRERLQQANGGDWY